MVSALSARHEPDLPRPHSATSWLEIDDARIGANVRRLREIAGVPLLAVVKADGYGHGAVGVARAALENGAAALAAATLGEAVALRAAGIGAPILLLGAPPLDDPLAAAQLDITCTVFDRAAAEALARAAVAVGRTARAHLKVDTGMHRLGVAPADAAPLLAELRHVPGLAIAGIYTHLATADEPDETLARLQLDRFDALLAELARAGLRPRVAHAANSATLLRFPRARYDMVRPGIACYGIAPSDDVPLPDGIGPALTWKARIIQVRDLPPGEPVSYGARFVTARPSRIATIAAGYADGLRRAPAWREVLVRGRRAPIVGRICMDFAMVDVTDVPDAAQGDEAVLLGRQGAERITPDEAAAWLGTSAYEVVTSIGARVPRRRA